MPAAVDQPMKLNSPPSPNVMGVKARTSKSVIAAPPPPWRPARPRGHGDDRHDDGAQQAQEELEEVGGHHAPQAGQPRVEQDEDADGDHEPELALVAHVEPQRREELERVQHLHHGQHGQAHGHRAHDDGEQEALGRPEDGGRPAAVADLRQLVVRHDPGPAPEPGEDVDQDHVGDGEVPPLPVPGDAPGAHHPRHVERRVDGEGGGRHGCPGQPPRQAPAPTKKSSMLPEARRLR
jgi:hypothetical protein